MEVDMVGVGPDPIQEETSNRQQDTPKPHISSVPSSSEHSNSCALRSWSNSVDKVAAPNRDPFRDVQVKVHIRRPERDSWMYLGRGLASQEVSGHSSRVGEFARLGPASYRARRSRALTLAVETRTQSSARSLQGKSWQSSMRCACAISVPSLSDRRPHHQSSDLQAEKRGNFVVISMVDGSRVVSWSLNVRSIRMAPLAQLISKWIQALNNSETLRLLASIELACYRCKQALVDPRTHVKSRRKIERIIKDDRRKRHRRRKDQDAMIDAFSKQTLTSDLPAQDESNHSPHQAQASL